MCWIYTDPKAWILKKWHPPMAGSTAVRAPDVVTKAGLTRTGSGYGRHKITAMARFFVGDAKKPETGSNF